MLEKTLFCLTNILKQKNICDMYFFMLKILKNHIARLERYAFVG